MNTYRFTIDIKEDHTIILPPEIPQGTAEVLVMIQEKKDDGATPFRGKPYQFDDPFSPAVDPSDWNACR